MITNHCSVWLHSLVHCHYVTLVCSPLIHPSPPPLQLEDSDDDFEGDEKELLDFASGLDIDKYLGMSLLYHGVLFHFTYDRRAVTEGWNVDWKTTHYGSMAFSQTHLASRIECLPIMLYICGYLTDLCHICTDIHITILGNITCVTEPVWGTPRNGTLHSRRPDLFRWIYWLAGDIEVKSMMERVRKRILELEREVTQEERREIEAKERRALRKKLMASNSDNNKQVWVITLGSPFPPSNTSAFCTTVA